jgi:16S rRNA (uracil1498-N3)-methyltransferase
MRQFFIEDLPQAERAVITGADHVHLSRVLRMAKGDELLLVASQARRFLACIEQVAQDQSVCRIKHELPVLPKDAPLTLAFGVTKRDALEQIFDEGTQMGVTEFIPLVTERSVVRLADLQEETKIVRWSKIVREAACQCNRAQIPAVKSAGLFDDLIRQERSGRRWLACEKGGESFSGLAPAGLGAEEPVCIVLGPEGGFSAGEIELAEKSGWLKFTLGQRILRTPVAVVAALAWTNALRSVRN